jgi:hypothetical protein
LAAIFRNSVFCKNTLDFYEVIKYNVFKLIIKHDERETDCAKCTENRRMVEVGHFGSWIRPGMANDELRRDSPGIANKDGCYGNLGGNAGISLVPVWDEGFFYFF